jgi:hypothetical protein
MRTFAFKLTNMVRILLVFVALSSVCTCISFGQTSSKRVGKTAYEEVDFEDMMHRYFGKATSSPLEGIYSVSCVITKRTNRILSKREKIQVVERKDNYGRIAIMKDWPGSKRDFIEVSMSYRDAKKYPIVGELNEVAEGRALVYRHIEPDGQIITFSMIRESEQLLEAEYSVVEKRKTITYRLSYLKMYPKTSEVTVKNN